MRRSFLVLYGGTEMKNNQVLHARIDLHTRRKLDTLAKKTLRSRSDVLRLLIQNGDIVFNTPLTVPIAMPEEGKESTEVSGDQHD